MINMSCHIETGKREKNDDRISINKTLISQGSHTESADRTCLVVVCDGVGGESFGNEAAETATALFSEKSDQELTKTEIENHIITVNNAIIHAQKKTPQHAKMATTIAGLYINNNDFITFNIGDSRIYRYRSPYIMQISTDHSLRQQQIDMGDEPTPGSESTITRYLGGNNAKPSITEGKGRILSNDIFVLCSDGVWGSLENEDFEQILTTDESLETKCQTLVSQALQNGSTDNLSVIIVEVT